nr:putative glycosyltransferase GT2 [Dioscorea zingiberensis]
MTSKAKDNLHILFFPFMAGGHIIPTLDLAKAFATHGVTTTILTTPSYSPLIQRTINHYSGQLPIHLSLISFPTTISGLPSGCDSVTSLNSQHERIIFLCSLSSLCQPFKRALTELRPDCIITDMFFPWTSAVARELQIPRLVFQSESFFSLCMTDSLLRYKPHLTISDDVDESFILPGLPHPIKMSKSQILDPTKITPEFSELFSLMGESAAESYGVVVNSFLELEPEYAKHYREFIGRRAWHVGPVSLCSQRVGDDDDASKDHYTECLKWLDSKKPGSVVYVCFGSMFSMPSEQLTELAIGLEACEHPFIWVVIRMKGGDHEEKKVRVLEGGKGVVINGWAPQLVILNHPAVGAFITHCGWNSTMESICAGVPMITWPLFGDQFYNERFIVDVLKVGVEVGVKKFVVDEEEMELVKGEDVKKAVERMMGDGDEKESMRRRLRELGEMARRAVEEGGSSYVDLKNLIKELCEVCSEHDMNLSKQ